MFISNNTLQNYQFMCSFFVTPHLLRTAFDQFNVLLIIIPSCEKWSESYGGFFSNPSENLRKLHFGLFKSVFSRRGKPETSLRLPSGKRWGSRESGKIGMLTASAFLHSYGIDKFHWSYSFSLDKWIFQSLYSFTLHFSKGKFRSNFKIWTLSFQF